VFAFTALKFSKVPSVIKSYIGNGDKETKKKQCGEDNLVSYYEPYDKVNPETHCKNEETLRKITNNSHRATPAPVLFLL
jgi:hypothetical protein